jgi:thiol:disulfide interchange protein DsbC
VIEVDAGREIDVVITKGVRIDVPMTAALSTSDRGSRRVLSPKPATWRPPMMATTESVRPVLRTRRPLRHLAHATALVFALSAALAASAPALAATPDETKLLASAAQGPPGNAVHAKCPAPTVDGIYEVWMSGNVAYVAATNPRFFIFGRLFDTQSMKRRDGSEDRAGAGADQGGQLQSQSVSTAPVSIDQLPLADAIKTVRGNGQRKVAVFSDPNCIGYCKQLEPELAGVDNVTVYTFLVPFQGEARPISIWCAADREQCLAALDAAGRRVAALNPAPQLAITQSSATSRSRAASACKARRRWSGQTAARTDGYVDRNVLEARLTQTAAGVQQ